jgi:hypothetical protein
MRIPQIKATPATRRPLFGIFFCFFVFVLVFGLSPIASARQNAKTPEQIEWTWEVRPAHPDPSLPNVLLLGDSISRDYFPIVSDKLSNIANVYLMASSVSVGDERLELQIREFASMEGVRFSVVHFNNGMHGWGYDEEHYKAAFPGFIRVVRKLATRHGVLIWASTTPVKSDDGNGPTNRRIDARNAIAASMLQSASILSDDQHALMMQHQDRHSDSVHFDTHGAELEGDQAAALIKTALSFMPGDAKTGDGSGGAEQGTHR